LPSDPVTLTEVELVAITVKLDELPSLMVLELAVMLTVGAADVDASTVRTIWKTDAPPHRSHSSTVDLWDPTAMAISVFIVVASTT
jgi:hypothetical protein